MLIQTNTHTYKNTHTHILSLMEANPFPLSMSAQENINKSKDEYLHIAHSNPMKKSFNNKLYYLLIVNWT